MKFLAEMKAGRCVKEGTTIKPDPRKGLIYLYQSEEDTMVHFCWKEKGAPEPEDDRIVFPFDVDFIKINTGSYVLKFKSSSDRLFYWSQDPDAVREEKIVKKINEIINNPPQLEDYDNGEDDGEGYEQDQADMLDLSPAYADEELVDANLAQFLRMNGVVGGGGGEATSSPVAPALNPPQQQLKDQLRKILANFTGAASAPTAGHNSDGSGYGGSSSTAAEKEFELTSVITGESIKSVMNDPAAVEALFSYLPEDCPKTKAEMEDVIRSPQFTGSLRSFGNALRSGQLGPLLMHLGLKDGMNVVSVRSFIEAIHNQHYKDESTMDESK